MRRASPASKNLGNKLGRRGDAGSRDRHRGAANTRHPMTSTSSASTTCPASCGRSSRCWMPWASGSWPASAAMPVRAKWRTSHRARAAMMVCSKAMINIARKMEERYGIPFFEGSFYGIGDMSRSLRQIARLLVQRGAPEDIVARTEAWLPPRRPAPGHGSSPTSSACEGEEGAADHRRREILVGGRGAAGSRHGDRRHQRQEIHQGGQGPHQGNHGRRGAHDRRHDAARDVQDAQGSARRHHAVGRAHPVRRAEGEDAVVGHQPGAPPRLWRATRAW